MSECPICGGQDCQIQAGHAIKPTLRRLADTIQRLAAERDEARAAAKHLLRYTTLRGDLVHDSWLNRWPWLEEDYECP